jgi:hypothetical protein
MALDSAKKRASCAATTYANGVGVVPDASGPTRQQWRATVGYGYYGATIEVTWTDIAETMNGTTAAGAAQVVLHVGPRLFNAGTVIKIQGKFNQTDSGSVWLDEKCVLRIWELE